MNIKNFKLLNGTYGLELESIYTATHNEHTRFASLPKTSLVQYKTDGSIDVSGEEYQDDYDESGAERGQRRSVEVVTRPRKLSNRNLTTLDNFLKVYRKEYNGRVNRSTGLHLHLGHGEVSALTCGRMNNIIFTMQKALHQIVPRSRAGNQYCKPLDLYNFNEVTNERDCMRNAVMEKYFIVSWRYNTINSNVSRQSVAHGNHVEIRMHSGTLNIEKIKHWLVLWTNIIEYAYSIASDTNKYNTYFATIIDRMTNGTTEQADTASIVFSIDNAVTKRNFGQYASESKVFLSLSEMMHITNIPLETKAFYYDRRNELLALNSSNSDTDTTQLSSELVNTLKGISTGTVQEPPRVAQLRQQQQERLAELEALRMTAVEKLTARMKELIQSAQKHLAAFLGVDFADYEPSTIHDIHHASYDSLTENSRHLRYWEHNEMDSIFGSMQSVRLYARHTIFNHDPSNSSMSSCIRDTLEKLWRASDTELKNMMQAINWLNAHNNGGLLSNYDRYTLESILWKIQKQQLSTESSNQSNETATVAQWPV